MDFPILKTERLLLREWTDNDYENIFQIRSHESVAKYTSEDPYQIIADSHWRVDGSRMYFHEKNMGITWGIFDKESGRVLGDIDFTYKDRAHFRIQLGCMFAPHAWGKGYATEAMKEVIRYGFEDFPQFKIHRMEADTDPRNASAIKLLENIGFRKEGLLLDYYFERGRFVDKLFFGLLRSDWEKKQIFIPHNPYPKDDQKVVS